METNKKFIQEEAKRQIADMIDKRYQFTLRSHDSFLEESAGIPIINLIGMSMVKSDRKKYYKEFQVKLKLLADRMNYTQKEITVCLLEMLEEARVDQSSGTEQILTNVLYEMGTSMGKMTDKRAHNKEYSLNPKKVAKIWQEDFKIVDKKTSIDIEME